MPDKKACASCGTHCLQTANYCPRCGATFSTDCSDATRVEHGVKRRTHHAWLLWLIGVLAFVAIRGYFKDNQQRDALPSAPVRTADDIVRDHKIHILRQKERLRLSEGNPELYRQLREDDEQAYKQIWGRD